MEPLCETRAVKVLKYLHQVVPPAIARAGLDELERLPSSVLAGLHATPDWGDVTKDPELRDWLAAIRFQLRLLRQPGGHPDRNPEVCDSCAGNCDNVWFDLFDQNGAFMGGTADTATASGFAFFINAIVSGNAALDSNSCLVQASQAQSAGVYPPPFLTGELLSYTDDGTPGNVSAPDLVGFDDWQEFRFLFAGRNVLVRNRIYAVPA